MPLQFNEGTGPYTVTVAVTNTSQKLGQPWAATLTLQVLVSGPATYVSEIRNASFAAGETKTFSFQFSIPIGDWGPGSIQAAVRDPAAATLDGATVTYEIQEAPIDYGADVTVS